MKANNDLPIACQLTDAEMAARRQLVADNLLPKIQARDELADGYAFSFPATDEIAQELLTFVLLERQCCPFFQIELVFTAGKGATWLHLRGGEGAKRFIETELAEILA